MRDDDVSHLETVGAVVDALNALGLNPILVGGMALVILGSQRITKDFDFVIDTPGDRLDRLMDAFYDRGFELAGRVNKDGEVTATIGNRRVAAIRLRLDEPASVYFYNPKTRLRIDLLFDFPVQASALAKAATIFDVGSTSLRVASEDDLLRLKKIASAGRSSPGDAQDISFLERRIRRRR